VAGLILRHGALEFPALAMGEGPVVLLLHGFPDGPETFAAQLPALAATGYRAVAPVMRGYAAGSIPADGDFHVASLASDVHAWVRQLGGPAHLVGHDWGASVAHAAVVAAPDLFRSLTVMAVPHPGRFAELAAKDPGQMARSGYFMDLVAPGAATRFLADDLAYLDGLWRKWSPGWVVPQAELDAMHRVFRVPGVLDAALAWYRQALMPVDEDAAARAAALMAAIVPVPALGIVGADDGCVSAALFTAAMATASYPAGVQSAVIAEAGHFVQREAPDRVNALLLDFLAGVPSRH
jgi:pimeloyl-ACP methyl ester carboxylesterase